MHALASELKTTLVIYSIDSFKATEGWCWVISPDGEIRYKELNLSMVCEEENFKSSRPSYLRSSCQNNGEIQRSSYIFLDEAALDEGVVRGNLSDQSMGKLPVHKLWYQALIEPISSWLPTEAGARVTFVADSAIQQLPFAIFTDADGMPLLEKYTLISIPSIETLLKIKLRDQQKETGRSKKICIVANPTGDLNGAQQEGVNASQFFDESISLPSTATNQEVTDSFSSVGSIHLACHGAMIDSRDRPLKKTQDSVFQGALTLAQGPMFADDIVPISMNVDLAILSACESGKGHLRREGVVGLYHAFLGSGASTVIATHWKVPDEQANAIISSFYNFYFKGKEAHDSFDGQCFGKSRSIEASTTGNEEEVSRK